MHVSYFTLEYKFEIAPKKFNRIDPHVDEELLEAWRKPANARDFEATCMLMLHLLFKCR